jgi:hypothetical protein
MATWQQIKNKTDYVTVITTPSIEKLPVAQSGKKKKKNSSLSEPETSKLCFKERATALYLAI